MAEAGRIESVSAVQVRAELRGDPLLTLRRAIGELRTESRSRIDVDASG
jgi:hypothetical protein